jgi:hypothetical protein
MKCSNSIFWKCPGARADRGVALILTLIMLAIITIVVVVFLATTSRNRASTTVRIDQTTAEFAAESAWQHVQGKLIEEAIRRTNLLAFDFLVSRPRSYGYLLQNNIPIRPLDGDIIPPVVNAAGTVDVYLDLNRNRHWDDAGNPTNSPFGDPIWIGILDRPWFPHSRTNRFVARYAYFVQPVGKSLDLNTIHNDTSPNLGIPRNSAFGFMRNQGVGPWELNLGAFLHELDPVVWDYDYSFAGGKPEARGTALADARSIVNYRHGWPGNGLPAGSPATYPDGLRFAEAYPISPANNSIFGSIDFYSDGNNGAVPGTNIFMVDDDTALKPRWPGAETTNHFFHIQEFFDKADVRSNKVTVDFYSNLTYALTREISPGVTNGTLYYKMLAQLGTQTGSAFDEKINLNWADKNAEIPGFSYSPTNFVPWDASPVLAVAFFTNVAERIFRTQSNDFNPPTVTNLAIPSITQIPIYPTNMYSSAIHRILQLTANIFDATRTNIYPSVFRPIFGKSSNPADKTVYIIGYTNDERLTTLQTWLDGNTNGIPLVVGAKKGFPNFNEYTIRTDFLLSRKLQVTRPSTAAGTLPDGTNQMYVLGISNYFGVESWNSYETGYRPYPRPLTIIAQNETIAFMTNSLGFQTNGLLSATSSNWIPGNWRGSILGTNAFRLTMNTNLVFLSNAVYRFANNTFANVGTNAFETFAGFPVPDWILTLSNRLTYLMLEPGLDRIIDFVLLDDKRVIDLHSNLVAGIDPYSQIAGGVAPSVLGLWSTNRSAPMAPTEGILKQLDISQGLAVDPAEWRDFALLLGDKDAAINAFRLFCGLRITNNTPFVTNDTLAMESPFNPAAKLAVLSTWQANDPLVHYHAEDLRIGISTNVQYLKPIQVASNVAPASLGLLNVRYSPWYGNPNQKATYPETGNATVKDAGINGSIAWQFPSNKIATVGLLGRVHRGTPWQTVYFKADYADLATWSTQSGDLMFIPGRGLVSRTHPTNDWSLLDIFTTSLDERMSTGLVSVNQTNLETWSALFSGIVVLSNALTDPFDPSIDPRPRYEELLMEPFGGVTNAFFQIWTNIHWYQFTNGQPLRSVGELIQKVPELTTRSPFLDFSGVDQLKFGLDDFAFEQIPQQILGLLRVGSPRFAIYAYGQALKPQHIDPSTGVVDNYQVSAEFATRTVLRLEGDPRGRVRTVVESYNILPPD